MECTKLEHRKYYKYTCKKCHNKCSKRKTPLKSGNWCDCESKHNIYTCVKCWGKVGIIEGLYYLGYEEKKEKM